MNGNVLLYPLPAAYCCAVAVLFRSTTFFGEPFDPGRLLSRSYGEEDCAKAAVRRKEDDSLASLLPAVVRSLFPVLLFRAFCRLPDLSRTRRWSAICHVGIT